jgi:hypothetical protein
MTGTSPSNYQNPPLVTLLYSPLKLRGDEGGLRGRLLLPFVKGGEEGFEKPVF